MALEFGIAPPAWLQDDVKFARTIGDQAENSLYRGLAFGVQSALAKEKILSEQAQVRNEAEAAQIRSEEHSAWMEDQNNGVSKWALRPPGDSTELDYTPKSKQGIQLFEQRRNVDEQIRHRKAVEDYTKTAKDLQIQEQQWSVANRKENLELDQVYRGAMLSLPLEDRNAIDTGQGVRDKFGFLTPAGRLAVDTALKANNLPAVVLPGTKAASSTDIRRNVEYIKELRAAGENDTADLVENILRARGHLGAPKLSGEDSLKEKDLTKQIQILEKKMADKISELGTTPDKLQEQLVPIQQQILDAQTKRHKLYLKNSAPSSTAARIGAAAASATAAPAATDQIFTDKSGKKFKYKGTMSDPSQDKNPNSWELTD